MARRRGPRDSRMGVGGMAGDLGYGERGMVESTAMSPMAAGQTGGPQGMMGAPQGPPNLGMAVEPFAPTDRPDQPITAGLEPDAMMSPDPADVLRAMYRRFPYPDLRRLLERAQMTDYNAMARQEGMTRGQQADAARLQGQADRFLGEGSDPDQSSIGPDGMADIERRMGNIRGRQGDSRFEGSDPDRSVMSPSEQADVERRMGDVRRDRAGGRF